MRSLLVPVDFTDTSENAVNFAAEWSRKYNYNRIILLKTFYDSIFENLVVSAEYSNVSPDYLNDQRANGVEELNLLCSRLAAKTAGRVTVMTAVSELPLLRAIMEVVKLEKPELMIVGTDNYRYSSDSFIAGNLISIARVSPVRVLTVPADYPYQEVHEVLVPVDFNKLDSLNKLHHLRTYQQWTDLKLMLLNVDPKERYSKPGDDRAAREKKLHSYLQGFEHEFYYSNDRNIIEGIMNFTKSNKVQLIVALPGRYSFLYSLTHKSISEAIYRNARQPVLILK